MRTPPAAPGTGAAAQAPAGAACTLAAMRSAWTIAVAGLSLAGCLQINTGFDPPGAGSSAATGADTGDPTSGASTDAGVTQTGAASTSGSGGLTGDGTTGAVAQTTGTATTAAVETTTDTTASDATTDPGDSTTGGAVCEGVAEDLCESQQVGPRSYLLCHRHSTWDEARTLCEGRCQQLARLEPEESLALMQVLRSQMTDDDIKQEQQGGDQISMTRASWWIGGHRPADTFEWLDGTPMPPKGTGGWGPNDPDGSDTDDCVVLGVFAKEDENGKWFNRDCEAVPYRFVCAPP